MKIFMMVHTLMMVKDLKKERFGVCGTKHQLTFLGNYLADKFPFSYQIRKIVKI